MTIEELFKLINAEKPKGMSLEKYMIKHPKRNHSRSTLILVARNMKQCLKQNRMPSNTVLDCLTNYFNIDDKHTSVKNPELVEEN